MYFILTLLASADVWVAACIITLLDIFLVQDPISIEVDLSKRLLDKLGPKLVHRPDDHSDELIEVDHTASVDVESLE